MKEINILGKDYLTEIEAAHYCGVCHSQFKKHRQGEGIVPIRHMGKWLYRRKDLETSIEKYAI